MDNEKLMALLDHMELVNWIKYMSYSAANVNTETVNLNYRDFLLLPSGIKVKITIKVEEIKDVQK